MKPKYNKGDRLSFIARNRCSLNGNRIDGKWMHYVGYVKQVRRSLFGVRYVMNVAKCADVFIVPQRDIIELVTDKSNNQNERNGNYR